MVSIIALTISSIIKNFGAGAACTPSGSGFLGFPTWYAYLPGETDALTGKCIPKIDSFADFWAIGLALVDILLRVGGLVAVVYVIYGGFLYMTSQGEPDKTSQAKNTIMNAVIGVIIVIIAIVAVNFIGDTIK